MARGSAKKSRRMKMSFTKGDVLVGKRLGSGGNGGVNSCALRLRHLRNYISSDKFALKTSLEPSNRRHLRRECHTQEALSAHASNAVVPYIGRYYRKCRKFNSSTSTTPPPSPPPHITVSNSNESPKATHSLSGFLLKRMEYDTFWELFWYLRQHHGNEYTGSIHPHVARFYIIDILQKLRDIHAAGYYHGDLKPENLMMTKDGRVLFTDFGASGKDCPSSWHVPVPGTLQIMAPE
ncbi:hypothetical protein M422DRAFT_66370 [Sphaerobolus stellatus SS14]|nr:hypothetical protein M422DRAFT_66370 [Sphaerobolus stellatus SS14]